MGVRAAGLSGCWALAFRCLDLGYSLMNQKPASQKLTPKTQNLTSSTQITSWKDLEVWKVAHDGVLRIYEVTKSFPGDERFRLIDQLCRAAASVPANIAEGKGRSSLREYVQVKLGAVVSRERRGGSMERLKFRIVNCGFRNE